MESIDTIIVAAGQGTRLGSTVPKAFVMLAGKPMVVYSLETFLAYNDINNVVIVTPASYVNESVQRIAGIDDLGRVRVTAGGGERWESVRNGLALCKADWVLVHDAARPFVTAAVIADILRMRSRYHCVITGTPLADTIREFESDKAGATIDRNKLIRVGTPQLFRRDLLEKAMHAAAQARVPPTDEAMLVQQMGTEVGIVWGDPLNFKITTQSDLEIAEALLAQRNSQMSMGG